MAVKVEFDAAKYYRATDDVDTGVHKSSLMSWCTTWWNTIVASLIPTTTTTTMNNNNNNGNDDSIFCYRPEAIDFGFSCLYWYH